jgi:hypothetical protein
LARCSTTAPWPKPKARAECALLPHALGRIAECVEGGFSRVRHQGLSTKVLGGSCPTGPRAPLALRPRASCPWHRSALPPCRPGASAPVRPGRLRGRGGSLRAAWVVCVLSPRLTKRRPKASGSHPYSPECLEGVFCVLRPRRLLRTQRPGNRKNSPNWARSSLR